MIRRLHPHDFILAREVRLSALADSPSAFGSTYERELAFTEQDWRDRVKPDGNPTFVWETHGKADGMVVAAIDTADAAVVHLVAMWVSPDRRGAGVGDALVGAVMRWAATNGASTVRLTVTEGNSPAERLYRRHGFERTGNVIERLRDGRARIEMERSASA